MTNQKVALVTGSGSGIGRACAIALAEAGFALALLGRKRQKLEETASAITESGGEAMVHAADVTDEAQVDAAFAAVVSHFGRLDVLFNNAGASAPKMSFDAADLRHFDRVIATNVKGAFLCARAAFRHMKAQDPQGGRIINNGSVSAHAPRPGGAAYTVSKHAVTGLTKQISLDGRGFNIACGQIDIGNAETALAPDLASGMQQPDGRLVPEPVMPLSDVAEAVVFMSRLPLQSNVQFMTIMATTMPLVGRG